MILGGSQANLLISALKRKQGTDLLSAPRITVVDGEEATITIAQEFIYPIQYEAPEPPQVNNNGGQGGGNAGGGVTFVQQLLNLGMWHLKESSKGSERLE